VTAWRRLACIGVHALAIGLGPVARAEGPPRADHARKPAAGRSGAEKARASKLLLLQELEIEGKVQRAEVPALTPPAQAQVEARPESLLPKVLEAVERDPF
jgi:hypothetical protein